MPRLPRWSRRLCARTQANRGEVPVDASGPTTALTSVTPRRLRDLPACRRAAANANTIFRSQPVASTSQSLPQSTHCPVSLMVISDIAIIPCGHCLCRTCLQNITSTAIECARCPVIAELTFPTPYVSISRRNSSTNDA